VLHFPNATVKTGGVSSAPAWREGYTEMGSFPRLICPRALCEFQNVGLQSRLRIAARHDLRCNARASNLPKVTANIL
jgi:hypothetical protein